MRSESRFVERDSARLHFVAEGQGPAVVLIHGWGLDLEMWQPQFPVLSEQYQVIALDRRGFGRSTGEPSIAEDVLDLRGLLDYLNVRSAAVLGMSQGARVALRFAMDYPDRSSCAILDGSPPDMASNSDAVSGEVLLAAYRDIVREKGIEAFRSEWSRHPLMKLHTSDERTRELLQQILSRFPGRDLLGAPSPPTVSSRGVASVQLPCLIINGAKDSPERRATGLALAGELPDGQLCVIPSAGHLPNLDNPVAYNAALMKFLATHVALVAATCAS